MQGNGGDKGKGKEKEQEDRDKEQVGNVHDIQVTEEEEDDCERRDRDRHRHNELIKLGAAGAGKSGKIGVCVTSRVTTSFTTSFLLGSSFTSRGVYNSTPCTKACHTTN